MLLLPPLCAGYYLRASPYILFVLTTVQRNISTILHMRKLRTGESEVVEANLTTARVMEPGFEAMSARLQNLYFLYSSVLPPDFYCSAYQTGMAQCNHQCGRNYVNYKEAFASWDQVRIWTAEGWDLGVFLSITCWVSLPKPLCLSGHLLPPWDNQSHLPPEDRRRRQEEFTYAGGLRWSQMTSEGELYQKEQ